MTPATIAADWNAVAPAWDACADGVEAAKHAATEALLRGLAIEPGDRVLELAAGPGALGAMWSALVGPTGRVVVSDLAPEMVEVARRRNAEFANIELAVLDVAEIDRPDDTFDAVATRMGLMFALDTAQALGEVHRVLVRGGRIGAVTWGAIEHNPWMTCVGMAAMANGLAGDGPPIGPGGMFSLGDPVMLRTLLEDAGFLDVAVEEIAVTFLAETLDAHLERVSSLAGPLAAKIAGATPGQRLGLRETAAQLAAPYTSDDGVALPGLALVATGRK